MFWLCSIFGTFIGGILRNLSQCFEFICVRGPSSSHTGLIPRRVIRPQTAKHISIAGLTHRSCQRNRSSQERIDTQDSIWMRGLSVGGARLHCSAMMSRPLSTLTSCPTAFYATRRSRNLLFKGRLVESARSWRSDSRARVFC
jgi:hypothetical protein